MECEWEAPPQWVSGDSKLFPSEGLEGSAARLVLFCLRDEVTFKGHIRYATHGSSPKRMKP